MLTGRLKKEKRDLRAARQKKSDRRAPERGERAQGGQVCCRKQRRGGQQSEGAIKRGEIKIKKIKKIKTKTFRELEYL